MEGQGAASASSAAVSWPPLSRPGKQWEEELWEPSGGVFRGRGPGVQREMQDRLHILEDLNMLYIRQMALSLEVMWPPVLVPQPHLALLSHPCWC